MKMAEAIKPLPGITSLTRPFWEAAKGGTLTVQRCAACGAFVWCPRPRCTECGADRLEWTPVSGRGTVYSFTVIRQITQRSGDGFAGEIPYVVAWIDLEEGPRLCSNVVGCPADAVAIGMAVEVIFEEGGKDLWLPKFRPR